MTSVLKYKRIFSLPGGTDVSGLTADVNTLKANTYEIVYFESVSAATGTITKPVGSTIQLDQFEGGIDAYVSTIVNGQPTGIFPKTAGGVEVDVASFDALGNYTLSGTPSAYPVAIIYIITIPALYLANALTANRLDLQTIPYGYKAGDTPAIGTDLGISEIVETDANRKLITAAKATGYNLALGTTAGTIAAGNDSRFKGYVLTASSLAASPADATTYYIGYPHNVNYVTAGFATNAKRIYFPAAGTITRVNINIINLSLDGSTENSTFYLRLNDATDITLSTAVQMSNTIGGKIYNITGLTQAVVVGDYFVIKFTTPTWVANPTGNVIMVSVYIE